MRRIFISFFLSILLLKYASSDSDCQTKTTLDAEAKETCAQLEASEDHYCTDNDAVGENVPPCKEADACNLLPPNTDISDGDQCAGYTTHKQGNHCKEITVGSEQKCKEVPACQGATPDTISYDNCKDLWTEDSSKKCVVNDDETACKVAENCDDVEKGANDDVCSLFSTNSQICVLNEEGCKVATECTDVKIGANANVCGLFTTDKSKCVVADNGKECEPKTICGQENYVKETTNCRDSVPDANKVCADTGNGCESQTPCEGVTYKDGTDCTKLPTVDTNKICRKHQTEGKCVEVTKPDNEGETGTKPSEETGTKPNEETGTKQNEETGTKPSEETGTKPNEETGTKPSEETGTKPSEETGTKPSEETSPTQGTETDLSKDNKGMLLNLSLYTLLIYFLF